MAITGAITATTATTKEVVVSIKETIGFPKPAVVAVDANLPVAEAPLMAVAVPPPAMIAKDQVITGSRSAIVATITAVPAKAARGSAILSSKLSTYGIKYAKTSIIVATPKCYEGRQASYPFPMLVQIPHSEIGCGTEDEQG